jgi:hypothetical protein
MLPGAQPKKGPRDLRWRLRTQRTPHRLLVVFLLLRGDLTSTGSPPACCNESRRAFVALTSRVEQYF